MKKRKKNIPKITNQANKLSAEELAIIDMAETIEVQEDESIFGEDYQKTVRDEGNYGN